MKNYYLKEIHLQRLKDEDEAGQFGIKIGVDDSFEHINLIIKISTNEEVILVDMVGYFKFSDDIKLEEKEKILELFPLIQKNKFPILLLARLQKILRA